VRKLRGTDLAKHERSLAIPARSRLTHSSSLDVSDQQRVSDDSEASEMWQILDGL